MARSPAPGPYWQSYTTPATKQKAPPAYNGQNPTPAPTARPPDSMRRYTAPSRSSRDHPTPTTSPARASADRNYGSGTSRYNPSAAAADFLPPAKGYASASARCHWAHPPSAPAPSLPAPVDVAANPNF